MRGARPVRRAAVSAAVLLAAACGSGSGDDATTAGQPVAGESFIPAALTGLVVAGDEAGWAVDREGAVWRIDVDGAVDRVDGDDAAIPSYNRGFSTFVDGKVVFAGTRCDGEVDGEACDGEAVVELRLLDEGDQSVDVVEIARARVAVSGRSAPGCSGWRMAPSGSPAIPARSSRSTPRERSLPCRCRRVPRASGRVAWSMASSTASAMRRPVGR